jgi:hypothetical protein
MAGAFETPDDLVCLAGDRLLWYACSPREGESVFLELKSLLDDKAEKTPGFLELNCTEGASGIGGEGEARSRRWRCWI